ncbi:MAG: lytic transglycosylase domain-containing protein [Nitrospinae bacterium]|nr:lytic transglycosylase domain-containing protein [Nitrospinota bacterium]
MKPLYRYGAMAAAITAVALLQFSQYCKAQLADARVRGAALEAVVASQHDWNMRNGKKIELRARISAILAEFQDSLHHDPVMLADLIIAKAGECRIDPFLVLGIIKTESDFRRFAVSTKGAVGLMQLRPHTAAALYGGEWEGGQPAVLTDNELNISLGTRYLARLLRRFGDLNLALEAYNRGPTRLRRDMADSDGVDRIYAGKVMANYHRMRNFPAGRSL